MSWLTNYVRPKIRALVNREDVPENLWHQCKSCEQMIFHRELEANLRVCPNCGTHVTSLVMPGMTLIKVGTLDDRSHFGAPEMAIFTCDAQDYHEVPTAIPTFEKLPG